MKKIAPIILSIVFSCGQINQENMEHNNGNALKLGHWLFSLDVGNENIPFNAFYSNKNEKKIFVIKNADEVITTEDILFEGDSVFIKLPVFGTLLAGKIISDTVISGYWQNTAKSKDYKIPFTGIYGREERFQTQKQNDVIDFSGKWDVTFSPNDENSSKAVGIFEQNGQTISGTFLTETGDFRYLQGKVENNNMMLSCFDGVHAFLFKAEIDSEKMLSGRFWSGNHWEESWEGIKNETIELLHPDSITYVTDENASFDFSFPDLDQKNVSLDLPMFQNKVIIIQIMGTWCPNCADETKDLAILYDRYNSQGLEIVAISYERSDDFSAEAPKIRRFKEELGANYTFLFGGKVNSKKNSEDFKMINGISSYPTAIYLDRQGKIRKVHTGYYGPGTGEYYLKYKEESEMFIEKLLSEDISI